MTAAHINRPPLEEVDKIEVISLVDNYSDALLPSSEEKNEKVKRHIPKWGGGIQEQAILAEHALSLVIRLYKDNKQYNILFDAGRSKEAIRQNIQVLGLDLSQLDAVILSHGHGDHYGGLFAASRFIGKNVPLIAHPDAFLEHYRTQPDGEILKRGYRLEEDALEKTGFTLTKSSGPSTLASGQLMITGEVERTTDFEFPPANTFIEHEQGTLDVDIVRDDQSLVIHLKGKGLVVISGCAHSGIINTLRYAQKITGVSKIYAVLGGFHLAGAGVKEKTEKTIEEMIELAPEVIVPMHCTSLASIISIQQAMPDAFLLNSVGTTFTFT